MKLTAATFAFNRAFEAKQMDIGGYIEACAKIGFDGIELNDGYLLKDPISPAEIKRRATTLGLDIAAVAIESVFVRNSDEEIAREKQNILDWLEKAYFLGSPILRVNTGQMVNTLETLTNRTVTWEQVRRWVVETYRNVVRRAERLGIVIAMENHYGATRTADDTLEVVRAVDSPWFKVNIDTGNFYEDIRYGDDFVQHPEILDRARPFEDIYAGIDKLCPEMVYCHAKIYRLDEAEQDDRLLDYSRIVETFHRHGYRGYVSIENFSQEDPLQIVPRATAMLKRKLRALSGTP
ncbi:MAG: sugar phosphate isomerase/epimerase [Phycisphaerae bacterium]|nr:sugar phosphate isomerase/epimerase [Phycisphaerae bacterium]